MTGRACTHCGGLFSPESRVFMTPGGSARDDYPWHFDRGSCLDAARAHLTQMQAVGRPVPPVAATDPESAP